MVLLPGEKIGHPDRLQIRFALGDMDAEYDRLTKVGIEFHQPPEDIHGGGGMPMSKFHFHAARESFDFAVELKIELFNEGLFERGIPSGIEIAYANFARGYRLRARPDRVISPRSMLERECVLISSRGHRG